MDLAPVTLPKRLVTLEYCLLRGIALEVYCLGCYRRRMVDPQIFVARFGEDYRVPNLNGKLKCAVCASQRCEVSPMLPKGA